MNNIMAINNQTLDLNELNQYITANSIDIQQYFSNISPFVDLIITSPPYWDAKEYGDIEIQTGYGQTYEEYLNDIRTTFRGVYNISKSDASLYLIIDTIKRGNKLIRLPDDLANILEEVGWVHQDTMIWDKVKTLPWSRKGQSRNVFEYILMFTKHKTNYKYNIEEIKIIEPKEWWVNYPERYSPDGTVPNNIWQYPIPAQGSWGKKTNSLEKEFKHACPFPPELAARIIKLSSNERDVVFDPYAGTGILLATAMQLGRKFLGFDSNAEYKNMFENATQELVSSKMPSLNAYYLYQAHLKSVFQESIIKLRILKYAKVLIKNIVDNNICNITDIINCISISSQLVEPIKNKLRSAEYYLVLNSGRSNAEILTEINKIVSEAPLSKYGLITKIKVFKLEEIKDLYNNMDFSNDFYIYSEGEVTSFSGKVSQQEEFTHIIEGNINTQLFNACNFTPGVAQDYFPQIISNVDICRDDYQLILDVTRDYEKTDYIKICQRYNLL